MFNEQTCSWFTWLLFVCCHHAQNIFKILIMLYFRKAQGPRTSKLIFPTVKYTNTNSQIHKYSLWQSARNTQHMLYYGTAGGSRMSKMIFPSDPIWDPIRDLKVRLLTSDFCIVPPGLFSPQTLVVIIVSCLTPGIKGKPSITRRSKTGFGIWDLPRKSFTRAKFGPFGLNWDFLGPFLHLFGTLFYLFSRKWKKKHAKKAKNAVTIFPMSKNISNGP